MPWTHRVPRKNCTAVAGVLDDGEEFGLELSVTEQNISTFKSTQENLKCYIISK